MQSTAILIFDFFSRDLAQIFINALVSIHGTKMSAIIFYTIIDNAMVIEYSFGSCSNRESM